MVKKIKNGFSLPQVLIALFVLGILTVPIFAIFSNVNKTVNKQWADILATVALENVKNYIKADSKYLEKFLLQKEIRNYNLMPEEFLRKYSGYMKVKTYYDEELKLQIVELKVYWKVGVLKSEKEEKFSI